MSCRCRDMSNCKKDMKKISEAKELFIEVEATNTMLSGNLGELAGKSMLTFYASNIMSLMSEEKKLNEDMTEIIPKIIEKCENELEKLNHEYSEMSREDHHYHSEKHHHHHHHEE